MCGFTSHDASACRLQLTPRLSQAEAVSFIFPRHDNSLDVSLTTTRFPRLAWAMVAGGGAWCAESAARRFCSEGGPTARRQIFTHLDAWLHATAYSPRSYYGSLLDKTKASRQPLPVISLVSLGCRFRRLVQASGPALGAAGCAGAGTLHLRHEECTEPPREEEYLVPDSNW